MSQIAKRAKLAADTMDRIHMDQSLGVTTHKLTDGEVEVLIEATEHFRSYNRSRAV